MTKYLAIVRALVDVSGMGGDGNPLTIQKAMRLSIKGTADPKEEVRQAAGDLVGSIFEKHKNNSDAEKYLSKSKLETVTKIGHALLKKKNTGVLPEKQEKLWVWTNPKLIAHLEELKGMTAGEKKRLAGEKQHLKNAEKKASAARGLKAGSASQQKRTPGKGKVKTPAAASKKVAATRGAKGKTNSETPTKAAKGKPKTTAEKNTAAARRKAAAARKVSATGSGKNQKKGNKSTKAAPGPPGAPTTPTQKKPKKPKKPAGEEKKKKKKHHNHKKPKPPEEGEADAAVDNAAADASTTVQNSEDAKTTPAKTKTPSEKSGHDTTLSETQKKSLSSAKGKVKRGLSKHMLIQKASKVNKKDCAIM
jgi:hypothetical protein